MDLALLALYVGLALGISFLCSLLEAVLLSVRTPALTDRKKEGHRGAALLLDLKQNHLDDSISSILTLNTISHTAGATLAGSQMIRVLEAHGPGPYTMPIGIFTGVLTFFVLVFSEIVPKTLGAVHATLLAGFVGRTLNGLIKVMGPCLVVTRLITRLLDPKVRHPISRGELAAVVALARREGTIDLRESALFQNVLRFEEILVDDVMTPRTVAFMLPARTTIRELVERPEAQSFSRIPLYEGEIDQIVGYIVHREVLGALAHGESLDTPLDRFKRDVWYIPQVATLIDALRQFQERKAPIALVADEHGGVSGLVTLEDLIETAFGVEIVDESDQVPDLRKLAVKLRDERLARKQRTTSEATHRSP